MPDITVEIAHEWLDQQSGEVRDHVEALRREAADLALGREGGRIKTPEEMEALHGNNEGARRMQVVTDALAEGRWVMFVELTNVGPGVIAYAPRYDEVDAFLGLCAVPFSLGYAGTWRDRSWRSASQWTAILRFQDIASIRFVTETPEQLATLETRLTELCDAELAKRTSPVVADDKGAA